MPRPRSIPLHCQQFLEEHDPATTTKVCTMCKQPKKLTDFYWNANCLDCYRPECIECNNSRYSSLDPSGFQRKLFINKRSDAKGKNIEFTIEMDDIDFPDACPITGSELLYQPGSKPLANTPSFDRVDPLLGYIPGNVQVISALANSAKSNFTISMLEQLLTYMKGDTNETIETVCPKPEDIQQRTRETSKAPSYGRANDNRTATPARKSGARRRSPAS